MRKLFNYKESNKLGTVRSVDTATVIVQVPTPEKLRKLQVNRLTILESSKPGQHLIGIIQKISRTSIAEDLTETEDEETPPTNELNLVRISLIGTHLAVHRGTQNVFVRTLETVPEIDAKCYPLEGQMLTKFMEIIARIGENDEERLSLGSYTLDDSADAYLNGNKFFQRHAVIVGGTGSGKSWTTAKILEQVAKRPNANSIIFDLHGEYGPMKGDGIKHYRIAGPADLDKGHTLKDGVIHLPYWLLSYDAMVSMFIDRSDNNAPNQAMVISRSIVKAKKAYLAANNQNELIENFTIDSPIPFDLEEILSKLEELNEAKDYSSSKQGRAGEFNGKLGRLIQRLRSKQTDRRLGFLFKGGEDTLAFDWLTALSSALVAGSLDQPDGKGGVKVINFSEVPSDILPLIVSLVAKLAFSVQQWTPNAERHPIALFCDEAHLYIPERAATDSSGQVSVQIFERIAKEGRKYGLGLVVISQRPSEVNRTVMSQCNNLVAMRLTNGDDQNVIRRLIPDSLGGFGDLLPILDTGEALVVGDATLLPTRIRIAEPDNKPDSATVQFWERWGTEEQKNAIASAVDNWRRQAIKT